MSGAQVFYLVHAEARRRAAQACTQAPEGWRVRIEPPPKSRPQEERYHAMIGDIAKQLLWHDQVLDAEEWKRLLIAAYVVVARSNAKAEGKGDPFAGQGRILPAIDGSGWVQCYVSSSRFTKAQAGEFIEYLLGWGEANGVIWSERARG